MAPWPDARPARPQYGLSLGAFPEAEVGSFFIRHPHWRPDGSRDPKVAHDGWCRNRPDGQPDVELRHWVYEELRDRGLGAASLGATVIVIIVAGHGGARTAAHGRATALHPATPRASPHATRASPPHEPLTSRPRRRVTRHSALALPTPRCVPRARPHAGRCAGR